jgi:hypothetical protein
VTVEKTSDETVVTGVIVTVCGWQTSFVHVMTSVTTTVVVPVVSAVMVLEPEVIVVVPTEIWLAFPLDATSLKTYLGRLWWCR